MYSLTKYPNETLGEMVPGCMSLWDTFGTVQNTMELNPGYTFAHFQFLSEYNSIISLLLHSTFCYGTSNTSINNASKQYNSNVSTLLLSHWICCSR